MNHSQGGKDKMKKKLNLAIMTLLALTLVLSACSGGNGNTPAATNGTPSETGDNGGIDNSKEVSLKMYLLGDAPKGMPAVRARRMRRRRGAPRDDVRQFRGR